MLITVIFQVFFSSNGINFGVGDDLAEIRCAENMTERGGRNIHFYFWLIYYLYKILNKDKKNSHIFDSPENPEKIPFHKSLTMDQMLKPTNMLVSINMVFNT